MFIPPPALSQKNIQASDWLGVWERSNFICDCVDVRRSRRYDFTTFLARCSQRRGGARAGVARARPSLPRATASRKNEREKRSRDREIAKKTEALTVPKPWYITAVKPCHLKPAIFQNHNGAPLTNRKALQKPAQILNRTESNRGNCKPYRLGTDILSKPW